MKTGQGHGLEVRNLEVRLGQDLVVVPSTGGSDPGSGDDAPTPPRRGLAVALVVVLLAGLLATLGLLWFAGRDDVETAGATGQGGGLGGSIAAPKGLQVEVAAPDGVVAGRPATFVVRWRDDRGTFSGASEEWGDGVGVSSVQQERCPPSVATGPGDGVVRVQHTWSEPGTYTVVLGVNTYVCAGGSAQVESATQTLRVVVAGR